MENRKEVIAGVTIAALGYFVDVYDLILFSVVRRPSLQGLGLPEDQIVSTGIYLLNMQMIGMLLGGIVFGILGDIKGRISVLYASITLYSIANLLNGMVTTVDQYAILRLVAGFGLAGELGAGITLVSETMSAAKRGYGTTLVASVGVSGAVAAGFVSEYADWRTCYYIGGLMGIALLFLRISIRESGMFSALRESNRRRGDLILLFSSPERVFRYLCCILIGLPTWYVVGILVTLSPEFARELDIAGATELVAGRAILFAYVGLVFGDLMSGLLSQWWKSRKKVLLLFECLTGICVALYLTAHGQPLSYLYWLCGILGFAAGFWAVFVSSTAERFGTNLRATVTTTVPNFVRGALTLINISFNALREQPSLGLAGSAGVVGAVCVLLSISATLALPDTYGRDLDFSED
jgi:MFS family permease